MNFLELHERLRLITRNRLGQGVSSRSLLARQTGLAQAHISNFLNQRRRLSLPALDRVLSAQALSIEDLSAPDLSHPSPPKRKERESMEIIPLVAQSVAMNSPHIPPRAVLDSLHLPSGSLDDAPIRPAASRRNWDRFVAVRVTAAQAAPMHPLLRPGAIAVIDRQFHSLADSRPPHPNLYAVRVHSAILFRYVVFDTRRLILRPHSLDSPVELLELTSDESPADPIVGRVCLCLSAP